MRNGEIVPILYSLPPSLNRFVLWAAWSMWDVAGPVHPLQDNY